MRRTVLLLVLIPRMFAQHADLTELLRAAVEKQQRGDYASAIRDYRYILKMRPEMVEAKIDLGAALSDTGKYDEAIVLFKEALVSVPDKKPVQMNLALAYFRRGDMMHAREQLAEVHQKHPEDEKATRLLADLDLRTGKSAEAVALLEPLDADNKNNMEFQFAYGTALIASGRTKEGVLRVQKVAEIENRPDAYFLAGSTLLRLDEFEIAREDLERALRLDPKLPRILTLVGIARDKNGDAASAEPTLRDAVKDNPDDFDANLTLGAILSKRRAVAEAEHYLGHALELRPNDQTARYEWGMLKIASEQYGPAADVLAPLSREYPDWLAPHLALSTVYYKLHRPEDIERERRIVERITAEQQAKQPSPLDDSTHKP